MRCDREELVKNGTCSRCTRLEIKCVARLSRQGQGPKKRQKHQQQPSNEHDERAATVTSHASEDGNLMEAFTSPPSSSAKFHYGIRYLIHSWTSFALTRRSFSLLGRASQLAAKCGVPMDDVFCTSRRDIINPILYGNQQEQLAPTDDQPPLQWDGLPTLLRNLCGLDRIENRYIMAREAKNGNSRYLVSDKFQQDIASLWLIEQTWKANEKPVVQLFLQGQGDFDKFTKAVHYQVSRYTHPGKTPEYVRVNGLNVVFNNDSSSSSGQGIKEMDLVYAFEIVTLEHSFYVFEFVYPRHEGHHVDIHATTSDLQNISTGETDDVTVNKKTDSVDDPLRLFDDLSPLEETEEDFEAFLALIND